MREWQLVAPKTLELNDNPPTQLNEENNVKVKIEEVLFSKSDYNLYEQPKVKLPFVLGRNAVGVVSEVFEGSKTIFNKMDRVVIEPFIPCNACLACKDDFRKCEKMTELGVNANGLLKNFVDLPASIIHLLPDSLSNEKALFVLYTALSLNIMDALKFEKGFHVAVFASSKAGIITAQLLNYYQAIPILISDNEELLNLAKDAGIFYAFNTEKCDVEKEVQVITGGRMCKDVIYFTNADFNMKDVYNVACFNSTICVAGHSNRETKISVSQIAQKHLTIIGVYNGSGNFPSAINLLVTGKINVDGLVGEKISFENVVSEIEKVNEKEIEVKSKIIVVD